MLEKYTQINFCLDRVTEMLNYLRPDNNWTITYGKPGGDIDDWKRKYFQLIDGEDYFFIYIDGDLTYVVNVTGDSVLTAVYELITKLAAKF